MKKAVCEKKVFIIEYFKQLLIRRNSIKIMKDTEIQTVFALQGWKGCGVCYIIEVLANDDGKQMKVVRYTDSNKKQSI